MGSGPLLSNKIKADRRTLERKTECQKLSFPRTIYSDLTKNKNKGKRTHGHGQPCGDCWEERGIKGLNGNGKNTIKIK